MDMGKTLVISFGNHDNYLDSARYSSSAPQHLLIFPFLSLVNQPLVLGLDLNERLEFFLYIAKLWSRHNSWSVAGHRRRG